MNTSFNESIVIGSRESFTILCVFLQKGNCSFISEKFTRYPRKMELADVVSTDSGNKDPSKFVVTVGKNS